MPSTITTWDSSYFPPNVTTLFWSHGPGEAEAPVFSIALRRFQLSELAVQAVVALPFISKCPMDPLESVTSSLERAAKDLTSRPGMDRMVELLPSFMDTLWTHLILL